MATTEYDFGYCKVRIKPIPNALSVEEGRQMLEEATAKYAGAIERQHPGYFKKKRAERRAIEACTTQMIP